MMKSMYKAPGKMYMVRPGELLKNGVATYHFGYYISGTNKYRRRSCQVYTSWETAQDALDLYADKHKLIWRGAQKEEF